MQGFRSSATEDILARVCLLVLHQISSFVHTLTNKYLYSHKDRHDIPHYGNRNEQQDTVEHSLKLILVPTVLCNEIYKASSHETWEIIYSIEHLLRLM